MNKKDTVLVDAKKISCDGSDNVSGHPKVFLEIKEDKIDCPYCGKIFILKVE